MTDDIFEVVRSAGGGARLTMEQALRSKRERFASLHDEEDEFAYDGIGDVLEQHGLRFEGGRRPDEYAHLMGPPTYCYLNALRAASENDELRYCEGLYLVGRSVANHGWCLDPDGGVVELTMPLEVERIGSGQGDSRPADPVEKWQYVGVVMPTEYVEAVLREASLPVLDDARPYKRDIFKRRWRWDDQGREI